VALAAALGGGLSNEAVEGVVLAMLDLMGWREKLGGKKAGEGAGQITGEKGLARVCVCVLL